MKIVTYLLAALLLAVLGAAAFFYLTMYKPQETDYLRMKAGMPELDRARAELKKLKDKESKESAWIKPVLETLKSGLSDELGAGTAEVTAAGNRVVLDLSETTLFTPGSVTFAKNSQPLLKLATLLRSKELKDLDIVVGNSTLPAPSQGRGRKKIPAKDARTLAAERSVALVKYLEKNGVNADALVAASYPQKQPDRGFKIKDRKTIITVCPPVAAPQEATTAKGETASPVKNVAGGAQQTGPKRIPIQPAKPKTE